MADHEHPEKPAANLAESSETPDAVEAAPALLDTAVKALDEEATREEAFKPKGAFRFVLVLIVGYIIYFFLTWHEIVILRGGA